MNELHDFATRYAKAWCSQNPESVAAFFAKNGSLSVNDGPPAIGRAAIAEVARGFMRDLPDMIVTMDDVTHGGGRSSCDAVFHWTLTGTNTGPGGTGKRVRISGYELWKIDNGAGGSRATWTGKPERVGEPGGESINGGLIAESKGHFDSAEYERQLKYGSDE
jgi:predicted ester cyclase